MQFNNTSSNNVLCNIQNIGFNNVTIKGKNYNKILDPAGEELTFVKQSLDSNIPVSTKLIQNYHNRFNPTTNNGFRNAEFGFVSLKVYDIPGKKLLPN